jgi:hypothetical protein
MNELFRTLPKLLKELNDNEDVREAIVFAAWKKIAGEALNEQTVAKRLTEKRLTIAVAGDMWKKHLESLSGQMIFKLNSMLGQAVVTFIEFQVDEKLVVENRKRKAVSIEENLITDESALKKISPKLQKAANAITDEALRNQFLLAAGNCLVRQEHLKAKK